VVAGAGVVVEAGAGAGVVAGAGVDVAGADPSGVGTGAAGAAGAAAAAGFFFLAFFDTKHTRKDPSLTPAPCRVTSSFSTFPSQMSFIPSAGNPLVLKTSSLHSPMVVVGSASISNFAPVNVFTATFIVCMYIMELYVSISLCVCVYVMWCCGVFLSSSYLLASI
jgi:hypothetical protein